MFPFQIPKQYARMFFRFRKQINEVRTLKHPFPVDGKGVGDGSRFADSKLHGYRQYLYPKTKLEQKRGLPARADLSVFQRKTAVFSRRDRSGFCRRQICSGRGGARGWVPLKGARLFTVKRIEGAKISHNGEILLLPSGHRGRRPLEAQGIFRPLRRSSRATRP